MNEDEEMFEDVPQELVDKLDDMKGKQRTVSVYDHFRFSSEQIETPSGVLCTYDIERKSNGRKKD